MAETNYTEDYDWHAHWRSYDKASTQNPAQQMRYQIAARWLVEAARGGGARFLDIGSGQGDLMQKVMPLLPGAEFLGIELSESGVDISRQKAPGATFVAADLFQPPETLQPFKDWASHAVCSEVLEHVDDPAAFLSRAQAYLKPGARLLVTVPGGPMSAFDRHIGHRRHFTRESIRSVLAQAGFVVNEVRMAGFPFFNLYRLAVIARGGKLARDVQAGGTGTASKLAEAAMAVFRVLFRFNFANSAFGGQVVAMAQKSSQ
jgi:2-polyprenyl-3-methyl-5-hydroxy-6-metoxy-1,4-benzoquinol methylase